MLDRRQFLAAALVPGFGLLNAPRALAQKIVGTARLRGAIDAASAGVVAGATTDQSRALQALIVEAARARLPVFLQPGDYAVSDITLPDGARITGVAGASRLVHGGGRRFLSAEGAARIELSDIVIDGRGRRPDGGEQGGLLDLVDVTEVRVENCEVVGSGSNGIRLERSGGRIEGCTISSAADAGLYAVESTGLDIRANRVLDCGNGGILVHRWDKGRDGTVVSGNRVGRIAARAGGTGEYGNGINVFRADEVIVTGNHVSDCAFSAVRANSASNVQISGNQCLRSGETAVYAEFSFEGAVISDNLIDGAANGILVVNFNEGGRLAAVSGNLIRNLSLTGPYEHDGAGFGFGISVEADTVVTGNVIENAPRYGMMLGWGPYLRGVVASANIIRNAPVGIYVTVVEGAGDAMITNTIFEEVAEGAIVGYRWNERATGDLIADPAPPAHLIIHGNRLSRKPD